MKPLKKRLTRRVYLSGITTGDQNRENKNPHFSSFFCGFSQKKRLGLERENHREIQNVMLKNGNKPGSGGARPGSGRPTDWLRSQCEKLVKKKKLIQFMSDVAEGKNVTQFITDEGIVVPCPAQIKDRITATTFLVDRAFGKPKESVEHSVSESLESILSGSLTI